MRQLRKRTHFLRPIAVLLLAAFLHGCMHWSDVPLEPQHLPKGSVRVTLTSGTHLRVQHPVIVHDSLVWQDSLPAGVPLAQIREVEARRVDPVATGFWVLTAGLFLVIHFAL